MYRILDLKLLVPIVLLTSASGALAQEGEIEAQLNQRAVNYNAKLPTRVDESTIWEKTVAGPGKRFTHVYKMTDFVGDSAVKRDSFAKGMRPMVVNAYCNGMKSLVSNGVTISFQYFGSDGKLIVDVVVNPKDCG